jgi:hypothetical protein
MMNNARTMSSTDISHTSGTHANRETTPTPYTEWGQKKVPSTWSVIVMALASTSTLTSRYRNRNGSDTKIA